MTTRYRSTDEPTRVSSGSRGTLVSPHAKSTKLREKRTAAKLPVRAAARPARRPRALARRPAPRGGDVAPGRAHRRLPAASAGRHRPTAEAPSMSRWLQNRSIGRRARRSRPPRHLIARPRSRSVHCDARERTSARLDNYEQLLQAPRKEARGQSGGIASGTERGEAPRAAQDRLRSRCHRSRARSAMLMHFRGSSTASGASNQRFAHSCLHDVSSGDFGPETCWSAAS